MRKPNRHQETSGRSDEDFVDPINASDTGYVVGPFTALSRILSNAFQLGGSSGGRVGRDKPVVYRSAPDNYAMRERGFHNARHDETQVWRNSAPAGDTKPDPALPGFQRTASDQLNGGSAQRLVEVRAKLQSAYASTQPVIDRRMFAGRLEIMKAVIQALEEQKLHVVVYGERGVGKTSLLQQISQAAKDARYLVVYIPCGQRSEFDETFRTVVSHIPLMFHSAYGPTSMESERGDTFASLLGPEPMTVVTAIEAAAKIEGTRVLVVLDDFDHATSEEFRRKIAEFLKSLSEQAVHLQVLIAGVPAELADFEGHVPSLHRNLLAAHIPRMTADEIREIILKGESISGVHFDNEAVLAIIAASTGSPYLTKLISYRAALVAIEEGRQTVDASDVEASIQDPIDELRLTVSRHAQHQVHELTKGGQLAVLGALARATRTTGGWFSMDDIVTALRDDPTRLDDARAVVRDLITQNVLIEIEHDAYHRDFRFAAPTLPDYISLLVARHGRLGLSDGHESQE